MVWCGVFFNLYMSNFNNNNNDNNYNKVSSRLKKKGAYSQTSTFVYLSKVKGAF